MNALLYDSCNYVDSELGFTMRMNYSYTENFELHYHNYFEFFLTISDNVVHVINGEKQLLPAHSLVFIRPGDVHTYTKEGNYSFINVTFTIDTFEKLCLYLGKPTDRLSSNKMPPAVILDDRDFSRVMTRLNSLNTIDIHDKQKMRLRMKLILTEVLSFFVDNQIEKSDDAHPLWLIELAGFAQKAENINMTLDDMSKLTGKSREHISRSFKKYYGVTVSEFMTEHKLNYCANLLLNTNLSVIDICYESGFQNLSWFYRKFKDNFGVTPVDFRKNTKRQG